jgi:hypothetical protein
MSASTAVAMTGTGVLQSELGEILIFQHLDVFSDSLCLCLKNFDSQLIQPAQSACTYSAYYNCFNLLIIESLQRIARTMRMMLVTVIDAGYFIVLSVDNNKYRSGTKMSINLTF